jgi:short-subunit dehydrogenase involved in D-alanine esterification of teichoic acids
MRHFVLDVADPGAIRRVAAKVIDKFPNLSCVFNIGFILQAENLRRDRNWLSAPGTGNSPVMGFVRF